MRHFAILIAALLWFVSPASANGAPPVTPAPAAAPATPATPAPVQSAPVTPSPANKPDEDNEPGAFMRRCKAAAAVITGNHASADASAEKDKEIAALKAENAKLTARVAAQDAELMEAVAYVKGLNSGAAPAAAAPSAAAQAAADAVQDGIAAAARQVGIPTTNLTAPVTTDAAPVVKPGTILTAEQKAAALTDYWKSRGHSVAGAN